MKRPVQFTFKLFMLWVLIAVYFVTLLLSGPAIFIIRSRTVSTVTRARAGDAAGELSVRTESLLAGVEQAVIPLAHAAVLIDRESFLQLIPRTVQAQPLIRTLYFIDGQGKTYAVGKKGGRSPSHPDYTGIDFSFSPFYIITQASKAVYWSDKFLSVLAGDTSIGAGLAVGGKTVVAELSLHSLLTAVQTASGSDSRVLVIDRRGELVVDTGSKKAAGILNVKANPVFRAALSGAQVPSQFVFDGVRYHPGIAKSEKLGWTFVVCLPAGLDNPLIENTLIDLLLLSFAFLWVAALTAPLITKRLSHHVETISAQAQKIAQDTDIVTEEFGIIREFNDLSKYMTSMAQQIRDRENSLRVLNRDLEERVHVRTAELENANYELRLSSDAQKRIQDVLIRSEKLTALGRLVAGIAHELNTPIGNAVMTLSSMSDDLHQFKTEMEKGLRKSALDAFTDSIDQGIEIAVRNAERAAELISSFKHVASDQTSSVRRVFDLAETLRDVMLTLHPMIKRTPHKIETDIPVGIILDSFPGVLAQIVTNLVSNALSHAWNEGDQGVIRIFVELGVNAPVMQDGENGSGAVDRVKIFVADNGRGISPDIGKKIFDPFFTTKMGRGGTGLGLHVAHNGAANVLGGLLDYYNAPEGGCVFYLDIPLRAPTITRSVIS